MLVSKKWLSELLDLSDLNDVQIADYLTGLGLEVEKIAPTVEYPDSIIVGKVVSATPHPDADTLTLCQVDIGAVELSQIVCGAPNVRSGMGVALATPGTVMPNGLKIKASKIRGVASKGMMCSESELQLSDDHDGIVEIKNIASLRLGQPIRALFSPPDVVFTLGLTPNRSDCLGYLGVARDLAAKLGRPLRTKASKTSWVLSADTGESEAKLTLGVEKAEDCPRFCAVILNNVKVIASPYWLRQRLESSGLRSRNLLVDVSNYVMLEFGQPNHIYDCRDISGNKLWVTRADENEKLITIDGATVSLGAEDMVIRDAKRCVGIAGVMGGENSEVKDDTTDVIVEVAYFDPTAVRKTARRLGIHTEASHRFERGVDIQQLPQALERICTLVSDILKEHNCEVKRSKCYELYPQPFAPCRIGLRLERVQSFLGLPQMSLAKCIKHLSGLGLRLLDQTDKRMLFEIPSWRGDLLREVDLIEEIARLEGYDAIPYTSELIPVGAGREAPQIAFEDEIKCAFASSGFSEVMTYPFFSVDSFESLRISSDHVLFPRVELSNPLQESERWLQSSLIPSLLKTVQKNRSHDLGNCRVFESARGFFSRELLKEVGTSPLAKAIRQKQGSCQTKAKKGEELDSVEVKWLGGVVDHKLSTKDWSSNEEQSDFHAVKSLVVATLRRLAFSDAKLEFVAADPSALPFLHPGAAAWIQTCEEKTFLGWLGELHPELCHTLGFGDKPPTCFEFDLDALYTWASLRPAAVELPPSYPFAARDLAFTVDKALSYAEFNQAVLASPDSKYLRHFQLFDAYSGAPLANHQKSFAIRCHFQSLERTLNDREVDREVDRLVAHLEKAVKATLR